MEEFGLDLSNILSEEELQQLESSQQENGQGSSAPEKQEEQHTIVDTEDLSVEDLFGSESVGEDNKKEETIKEEKTDTTANKDGGSSPENLYSSITNAFLVDGVFSSLNKDDIDATKITNAEEFIALIDKLGDARLDERQKRIEEALNSGLEPTEIQYFENSLTTLNQISEDSITDESEEGVNLRKRLLYNDFINKGYDKARAEVMVQRAFDNQTDVEDAKLALQGNKDFYSKEYKRLLDEAKKQADAEKKERLKQADTLRKTILEEDKAFGEVSVDKKTRQKIYDVIWKPVYTDPKTNTSYTELQKYEMEHHAEFMKNLGYLYVVTDGFKTLSSLTKSVKKQATREGLKELENKLNSTARNSDGTLKFVSGVSDNDSYLSGWSIDTK